MAIVEARPRTNGLIRWLKGRQDAAKMQTELIPLTDVRGWNTHGIPEVPPVLKNPDKEGKSRFMEIVGSRIKPKGVNEGSFDQIAMREVIDPTDPDGCAGTVGLLIDKVTGDVLIQSAEEGQAAKPGSPASEYVTLRPTLQGSYTNIKEHDIPFTEYADIHVFNKFVNVNPSRNYGKIRYGLVYVDKDKIDLNDKPNFAWFSSDQINEGIDHKAPFNGFLHAVWSEYNSRPHVDHEQPVFHTEPISHPEPTPETHETHQGDEGHKGKSAVADRAEKKSLLDIRQGTGAFDSLSLSNLREHTPNPGFLKWLNPRNWFKKKGGHGGH